MKADPVMVGPGRMPVETVRPPLVPFDDAEHSRLRAALSQFGALTGSASIVC
jgi:hypothetical protein